MKGKTVKVIAIVFSVLVCLMCFINIRDFIMCFFGYSDFYTFILDFCYYFFPEFIVSFTDIIVLFLLASSLECHENTLKKIGMPDKPDISLITITSKYIKSKTIKIIAIVFSILSGLICIFTLGYRIINYYYEVYNHYYRAFRLVPETT